MNSTEIYVRFMRNLCKIHVHETYGLGEIQNVPGDIRDSVDVVCLIVLASGRDSASAVCPTDAQLNHECRKGFPIEMTGVFRWDAAYMITATYGLIIIASSPRPGWGLPLSISPHLKETVGS
jgi:hypothetical protein